MTTTRQQEIEQILGAIREVEVNLDRRDARAYGAVLAMWGFVVAAVFAVYQWMVLDPAHDPGSLLWLHLWWWVAPVGVAFLVSIFVGARRWRVEAQARRDPRLWIFVGSLGVPLALSVVLVHSRMPYASAAWMLFLAGFLATRDWRDGARLRLARRGAAAALVVVTAAVLVTQPVWANAAAAVAFAAGLGGLGLVKYVRGE